MGGAECAITLNFDIIPQVLLKASEYRERVIQTGFRTRVYLL